MPKRPFGFTILALLLGWLSLAGFGIAANAGVIDSRPAARVAFTLVGLLYGTGALVAAIGLWRMRPWTLYPLRLWGAAAVIGGWLPSLVARNQPPLWVGPLGAALVGGLVLLVERYVRRRLAPHATVAA